MSIGFKASSIVGGPLDNTVIDQLSMRKEIVSKASGRTDEDVMFLNSTTGWVKMTSSVDVEVGQDLNGNLDYSNIPSRNSVLLGGTMAFNRQLGGIFNEVDTAYKKSELLGYRPMAGITGFQVDAKNNFGTLRIATVDFKVNSVEELDELEQLFLRPGFSVLLEWGHSLFYNNAGVFEKTVTTFPQSFFNKMGSDEIHDQIKRIKEYSSGNYDGMYGIIKNFIWSFNLDGGYDCRVDIVSKGELIESLSMIIAPSTTSKLKKENSYFSELQTKTTLHTFLNIVKNADTAKFNKTDEDVDNVSKDSITKNLKTYLPEVYESFIKNLSDSGRKFHVMKAQLDGNITEEYGQWTRYITLSSLLELLNIIFTVKTHDGALVKFFTGDKNNNVTTPFLTFNSHFALDPQIAVLPKTTKPERQGPKQPYYKISEQAEIPYGENDLLNIYINIDYILKTADTIIQSTEEKAKSLYDFVKSLLYGIGDTMGNINDFELHFEEEQSTYYIVDRKVTPGSENLQESFIDLIGLKSTLENVSFASKLSSSITTMMAISAQATSSNTGNDMLAMQTWQKGLQDRHNPRKVVTSEKTASNKLNSDINFEDQKRLQDFISKLNTNNPYFLKYNKEDIEGLSPTHRLQMVRYLEFETMEQKLNPAGLIPFELSFTMKGLGGMKIGQAFRVDDAIIPRRYRGNIAFLITGVSHSVKSNRWVTDIKTQMIVINQPKTTVTKKQEVYTPPQIETPFTSSPNPSQRRPIQGLTTSPVGVNLIKSYEGLELNAYRDPGSGNQPISIGYGTTRINGQPIYLGTTITPAQAESYLKSDIKRFEDYVKTYVKVDVTQQEFDALVSFTYNLGPGNLQSSTLRKKINAKDYLAAADQFLAWNKAGGKVLPGLTKRRAREKQLFLTNNPGNPA